MNRWNYIASMKLEMFVFCTILTTVLVSVNGQFDQPKNQYDRIENSTRAANVGGFEEVYRWKQMTFTPLRGGMLLIYNQNCLFSTMKMFCVSRCDYIWITG